MSAEQKKYLAIWFGKVKCGFTCLWMHMPLDEKSESLIISLKKGWVKIKQLFPYGNDLENKVFIRMLECILDIIEGLM